MVKNTKFNNYPTVSQPYSLYSRHGTQQQMAASPFPTAADWFRVLWPNGWFLSPAVIGILGASCLGFVINRNEAGLSDANNSKSNMGGFSPGGRNPDNSKSVGDGNPMFLPNVYTAIAIGGVSLYVVETLFSVIGRVWLTLSTIVIGTITAILLFAAMYFYVYRLDPNSFSTKYLGDNVFTQYYSFIYFSATTITVGSFGDILPLTTGSRTLVIMEVLFFLFILTSGIAAITQVRRK